MSSQRDKFYELFGKGMQAGSAGAAQAMKSHADLANMLAGKQADLSNSKALATNADQIKSTAQARELKAAQDAQKAAGPGGTARVGDTEIKGMDPLARLLQLRGLQDREENKVNDQAEKLSHTMQQSNIPAVASQMSALNAASAGPDGKGVLDGGSLKSFGPIANALPDFMVPGAEALKKVTGGLVGLPQGSAQERQAYRALQNTVMHSNFGARQTEAEKAMLQHQMGDSIGNTTENMGAALRGLNTQTADVGKNLLSGAPPAAVQRFKQQGGMTDFNTSPLTPGAGPSGQSAPNAGAPNPAMQSGQKSVSKVMRNKRTGQVRTVYSDGTFEDNNGSGQ